MNHTFTNFHKYRFEWANKAKKEFINRFVRLDVNMEGSNFTKELTISVYGPTQVGKTTVILSLLGLKQNMIGQLSKWLRGKRRLGESSTVTVMRYEKSEDDFFHIRMPNGIVKSKLSGEQLEAALQTIRYKVETNNFYSVEPVIVEIPLNYFEERNVNINIVDLPGVESAELKEVNHVKQCIKHWLPLSEVCLLVDDSTQLTSFTQYQLKEIKNWYENLENFRIIPTRALSLENIRKNIGKNIISTAEDLVSDYAKVLNRVLKMDLDLNHTIYPIDVGNSWKVIIEKEPQLYEKMKDIMDEILQKLQNNLESLDVNQLSFSRLTKLYKEAEVASNLELEENVKIIQKKEKLIQNQRLLIKNENEEIKLEYNRLVKEIELYEKYLRELLRTLKKLDMEEIKDFVNGIIEYNSSNKKASVINTHASELEFRIEDDLEKQLKKVKEEAQNLKITSAQNLSLQYLMPIPKIDQIIDAFWFKSTYEEALFNTRSFAYDWLKEAYEGFNSLLNQVMKEVSKEIKHLEKNAETFKQLKERKVKNLQAELDQNQSQKEALVHQHREIYDMWKQDRAHARQLQGYFIKYWFQYKEELQQYFLYGNTDEQWLSSQYLQLLVQDGKKIIDSLNNEERDKWLQQNYLQEATMIEQ
jgi:hypothetical protein